MKFTGVNWRFLILAGIFLYLIVKRVGLTTKKVGCCGGHDQGENHNGKNERTEMSCCCSHKEKR